jgi:hypothetical protein
MKKYIKPLWLAPLGFLVFAPLTHAAITGVAATPSSQTVAFAQSQSLSLSWNVATNSAGSVGVSSAQGQFKLPNGTLLATVKQALSKTVAGPGTGVFPESVFVPADLTARANKEGFDHLLYERSFTDGAALTGNVTLRIATQKSAAFGLSRIALSFEDDKALITVARATKLSAHATLSVTGNGVVRAVWEIAGPTSTASQPEWRTQAQVNQLPLGGDTVGLVSPLLPTDTLGAYLVRLRILEPATALDLPVIRYVVGEKKN